MKIKSIKIKGWRSYNDQEGIELNDLKKINLIIGPNNAGKSNLLKFFHKLESFDNYCSGGSDIGAALLRIPMSSSNGGLHINAEDFWDAKSQTIEAELWVEHILDPGEYGLPFGSTHTKLKSPLGYKVRIEPKSDPVKRAKNSEWNCSIIPMVIVDGKEFDIVQEASGKFQFLEKMMLPNGAFLMKPSEDSGFLEGIRGYVLRFFESLRFVDPVRHPIRSGSDEVNYFDGSDIQGKLFRIKENIEDQAIWLEYKIKIETWLKSILDEELIELDFVKGALILTLTRNNKPIRQQIKHLGTGVAQAFMLLTYLLFNQDKHLNIFFDEPENNLHPNALVAVVRILENDIDFQNHRFFISTHSPALLDMVSDNWTIHKAEMSPELGTRITTCNNVVSKHQLLDALGVRASQILQSNYIIWVEGPSDRQYIRKWIQIVSKGKLKEGRHFSFIHYGGAILSHVGIGFDDDNQDFLDLFDTSRYGLIVLDSDKNNKDDRSKKLTITMKDRLSKVHCANDYFGIWELERREIENYLPNQFWKFLLDNGEFVRKYMKIDDIQVNLQLDLKIDYQLDHWADFAEGLCQFYELQKKGEQMSKVHKDNIKAYYDRKKVDISRYYSCFMDETGTKLDEPLAIKVKNLVSKIQFANGIMGELQ